MNSNITRRGVIRGAAWTAPAIVLAASAPAFATSTDPVDPIPELDPVSCRRPGEGKNTKDYYVRTRHRDEVVVLTVLIGGREAVAGNHGWEVLGFKDSRIKRPVVITYTLAGDPATILRWSNEMTFPVCKDKA